MERIELENGRALVLVGPRGCGKTTLARKIAETRGLFVEIDKRFLETHRGITDVLLSGAGTVICDGLPTSESVQTRLKTLIVGGTVTAIRKYGTGAAVKAPSFIFCLEDSELSQLAAEDRRFRVIRLDGAAT